MARATAQIAWYGFRRLRYWRPTTAAKAPPTAPAIRGITNTGAILEAEAVSTRRGGPEPPRSPRLGPKLARTISLAQPKGGGGKNTTPGKLCPPPAQLRAPAVPF